MPASVEKDRLLISSEEKGKISAGWTFWSEGEWDHVRPL